MRPLEIPFGRQVRGGGSIRDTTLSAVLHVAVIALLIWGGKKTFVDANRGLGPDFGRRGGGGGGGGIRAIAMFVAHAAAAPAPPAPTPKPIVTPQVVPQTIPTPVAQPIPTPEPVAAEPTPQPGNGAGAGTGTGPGSGSGVGGGAGSGTGTGVGNDSGPGGGGGTVSIPQLQGMAIPPPNRPRELRGQTLVVTFHIDERGRVVEVAVDPPIKDRGYRDAFLERMRSYNFIPAHARDGHAVAASVDIRVTL